MELETLRLKKNEERRLRAGHLWIYSNEIDIKTTPIKGFVAGQEVRVLAFDKTPLGIAYVNPHSLITARLISRRTNARLDVEWFTRRLQTAFAWRQRVYDKPYYRLVFGESDSLPGLVVDRYGDHLAVQLNTAGMDGKREEIVAALRAVIPEIKSILFRNDSSSRLQEGLETEIVAGFSKPPETVLVEENGASFNAPLWTGQKTGWFYDHRLNRSRLKDYVLDKKILDVFSYLGAWGIQAGSYGAKEVVCLDSSKAATDSIEANARLNHVDDKVSVICDDAFDGLKKLAQAKQTFDVIVLDPPAFVKKFKDKKEGLIAYQRINEAALKLLNPGGVLFSCSCSMHMDYTDLVQALRKASISACCDIQIVERGHQAPDHPVHLAIPETDYLKMIVVRRMEK